MAKGQQRHRKPVDPDVGLYQTDRERPQRQPAIRFKPGGSGDWGRESLGAGWRQETARRRAIPRTMADLGAGQQMAIQQGGSTWVGDRMYTLMGDELVALKEKRPDGSMRIIQYDRSGNERKD